MKQDSYNAKEFDKIAEATPRSFLRGRGVCCFFGASL